MVRLQKVSKRYHDGQSDVWALREVDLDVPEGQCLALVGKSGSGKSTLLHLIAGLDVPSAGEIHVGNTALHALGEDERTAFRLRHTGLVFQFFHLLPGLTVAENVMFPAELARLPQAEARVRCADLLDQVGLGGRAGAFPDRLSGGEQQRVAIARSLILRPALLLADEPTGNLDAETGDRVSALLFGLARRHSMTLIVATHSEELARQADYVVELRAGRLVSSGTADARA
jgi:putative ABC transport system ATP-binding protein